jgi:DNA repair photolyase
LKAGPFANQPDVLALDYISGCDNVFLSRVIGSSCSGRTAERVALAPNIAERLLDELLSFRRCPKAVLLSPRADPFPPLREIQQETAKITEVLARFGIDTWLMTRGYIRPSILDVLRRHAKHVKVTVATTTIDRARQRMLEPLTAPPRLRLKMIHSLREAGIACNAALEPLIPGVTDTRENLMPLLEALVSAGIRQITVGYLVLLQRAEQHLQAVLRPDGLDTMVLEEYSRGPILRNHRGLAGRYLPRPRRQHGYGAIMAMAAGLGLRVSVDALTNPDFSGRGQVASPRHPTGALQISVH